MNWCDLINEIYATRVMQPGAAGRARFQPAASLADLAAVEARLDVKLPDDLKSLLRQSDGVMEEMAIDGGEWSDSMWLLWTLREMVEQNLFYRGKAAEEHDRDFRRTLFFAGAGVDGILFGFPVAGDGVCEPRVVVWHPIMDELDDLAPSLEDFLKGWLTGTISV